MPKLTKYSTTLVMALLAILLLAACANGKPGNIILTFFGGSGEKESEVFSIEGVGEVQLMRYPVLSLEEIEVKLYKLYEDGENELIWEGTWYSNGDKHGNIPPGSYYLKIYVKEALPLPAAIHPGPDWYIEVRDYPVQEP